MLPKVLFSFIAKWALDESNINIDCGALRNLEELHLLKFFFFTL